MWGFIAKYWIEFVFGIIATASVAAAKKFRNLYLKEAEHKKEVEWSAFKKDIQNELLDVIKKNREESKQSDIKIEQDIQKMDEEIRILKGGILAIQGNMFKKECRRLLAQDTISLEEMDELSDDYNTYHLLGGNHDGDRLYKDVTIKYRGQLEK